MRSAELVDRGSAPWVVEADGERVYGSSKYSKAVAWGTAYAARFPRIRVSLSYAGGRWVLGPPSPQVVPVPAVRVPVEALATQEVVHVTSNPL